MLAAQKFLQILISTWDDDNRKRKFNNGAPRDTFITKSNKVFLNLIYAILLSKLLYIDYSQSKFNWVRNNLMRARKTQVEI